jgi:hypothetical protein
VNINKHAIILPALITSAVSLHILSYYIEEPEEIVYNPVQTTSPSQTSYLTPTPVETTIKVVESVQPSKTPKEVKTPEPSKTPKPLKTPEVIQESKSPELPKLSKDDIIKSKDFKEIIVEARINSGRIDPFLSVKPPKMEIIPEIPEELINEKKTLLAMKIEQERQKIEENKLKTKIENIKIPKAKKKVDNILIKNNKVKPPIQIPKTSDGKKIIVENKNKQEEILVEEAKRLSSGLKLTGIVTGTKPLAILSVNDESKVLGVGDELINNGDKIRIVSIDFDRKSILITDGYYKARLLIEEE